MAHLLAKLGEAALKPQCVNGVWRKAALSARTVARLRRETLLAGGEWPYEKERRPPSAKKPKGHKHDRVAAARQVDIQKKLENMPQTIAEYRESRKPKPPASLIDRILLTTHEVRVKQK